MDDALDFVVFDSVYHSGGGSSGSSSNDNQPKWAMIMAAITMIGIVLFIIYGLFEVGAFD